MEIDLHLRRWRADDERIVPVRSDLARDE